MSNFRKLALQKIAASAGILTDIVEKSLNKEPNKPKLNFKTIGSVGPGTTVMAPSTVVKPDGSVDFFIQIRGISGGDTKTAATIGINAVIITAEAGGLGSKENTAAFGYPSFVNNAINKVLTQLQQQFPDKKIHRGKVVLASWSGGFGAVAELIDKRNAIEGGIDGVIFTDGLHIAPNDPRMKEIVEFAREASRNPNKIFTNIHTAVQTSSFTSSTQSAQHLLTELNLSRKPVEKWNGKGIKPVSEAKENGFRLIQLYSEPAPYKVKDPQTGEFKPNISGTAGEQHLIAREWQIKNTKDLLKNLFH